MRWLRVGETVSIYLKDDWHTAEVLAVDFSAKEAVVQHLDESRKWSLSYVVAEVPFEPNPLDRSEDMTVIKIHRAISYQNLGKWKNFINLRYLKENGRFRPIMMKNNKFV
jgi:hypothetical protein